MSKRFSDTDIWKKKWFCDLSPAMKCFWQYICASCDNAGVWEMNLPLAEFQIGCKLELSDILNDFNGNIMQLSETKLHVVDFVSFQFGTLTDNNNAHRSAIALLKKHNISAPDQPLPSPCPAPDQPLTSPCPAPREPLMRGCSGAVDMDIDKDKDKDNYIYQGKEGMQGEKTQNDEQQEMPFPENARKGTLKAGEGSGHPTPPPFVVPAHLAEIWPEFLKMRRLLKKPATERAQSNIFLRLNELSPDFGVQVKIVEQSITSAWQTVYPLKEEYVSARGAGVNRGYTSNAGATGGSSSGGGGAKAGAREFDEGVVTLEGVGRKREAQEFQTRTISNTRVDSTMGETKKGT